MPCGVTKSLSIIVAAGGELFFSDCSKNLQGIQGNCSNFVQDDELRKWTTEKLGEKLQAKQRNHQFLPNNVEILDSKSTTSSTSVGRSPSTHQLASTSPS